MTYLNSSLRIAMAMATALLFTHAPAQAQGASAYPTKPVKIIVPFGVGGAADSLPRLLAVELQPMWGQPIVIENRTGAAGNIGMAQGAEAAPDGYTLTVAPVGNLAINPHLYSKLKYDVFKDFTPITLIASVQNVLVVNPAVPAKTLAEFIALAKSKPGKLTFASGGVGSQAHMGGELLKAMAGIDMLHVAYKGVGESVKDVVGGQVDMIVAQIPAVKGLIETGKLRALAVASPKRTDVFPDLPTVDEAAGLKGYQAVSWYGLVGPAALDKAIAEKISSDAAKAIRLPASRDKLRAFGADPVGSTPAELTAAMQADYDRYGAIITKLGIKAD